MHLEPGQKVEGMTVVDLLGEGGFGKVYTVPHDEHDEPLALKVLNADLANEDMRKRFKREAEVVRKLDTDHAPRVHGFGELEDGSPYILMEKLVGESLKDVLDAHGKVHWRQAIEWIIQACEGLQVAHDAGVLHRDLKPDNLFVMENAIKILDFGVATFVSGHTDQYGALTHTSSLVGTPHYMSAEQVRATVLGPTSDIYMLGVVLYQLISGARPFRGDNLGDLLGVILRSEYAPLSQVAPTTPRVITRAVTRAMHLQADARFPSARAFAEELIAARSAESEVPPAFDPREKATIPATLEASIGTEAPTKVLSNVTPRATPTPQVTPTPQARHDAPGGRRWLVAFGALALVALVAVLTAALLRSNDTPDDAQVSAENVPATPTTSPERPTMTVEPEESTVVEPEESPVAESEREDEGIPLGVDAPIPEVEPVRADPSPSRMNQPRATSPGHENAPTEAPASTDEAEESEEERRHVMPTSDGLLDPFR